MADLCNAFPGRVIGLATLFPGEEGAEDILNQAFDLGLAGVKFHAHVQCFDMNAPELDRIYGLCREQNKPLVMHVGREPKSEHYLCDPYEICRADKLERVLKAYPGLKICVPHLGFDETSAYARLIEDYDTLWLDTAMVLTDYFPQGRSENLNRLRTDRIMYGSDFPNIPYAWDRELIWLARSGMDLEDLDLILYENAAAFYNLDR